MLVGDWRGCCRHSETAFTEGDLEKCPFAPAFDIPALYSPMFTGLSGRWEVGTLVSESRGGDLSVRVGKSWVLGGGQSIAVVKTGPLSLALSISGPRHQCDSQRFAGQPGGTPHEEKRVSS